jgi:hypothetical protein
MFAAIAMSTVPALGWNALGHKVVADITWQQLTPKQRQEIVDVLRRHPKFDRDFAAKMEDDAAKGDKATQDHWISNMLRLGPISFARILSMIDLSGTISTFRSSLIPATDRHLQASCRLTFQPSIRLTYPKSTTTPYRPSSFAER